MPRLYEGLPGALGGGQGDQESPLACSPLTRRGPAKPRGTWATPVKFSMLPRVAYGIEGVPADVVQVHPAKAATKLPPAAMMAGAVVVVLGAGQGNRAPGRRRLVSTWMSMSLLPTPPVPPQKPGLRCRPSSMRLPGARIWANLLQRKVRPSRVTSEARSQPPPIPGVQGRPGPQVQGVRSGDFQDRLNHAKAQTGS